MNNRKIGFFFVICGAIFWGIGGTVAQRLFQDFHVEVNWLVTVRLILAGILLLFLQACKPNRAQIWRVWQSKSVAIQLLLFGIVGMLAVQYTYMASIKHGNAAVATLLQFLSPVYIITYVLLRRQARLTKRDAVIVSLALLGCFFLLTNGQLAALTVPMPAIIWGILSGVAAAFYTVYGAFLLKKFDSLVIVGWAMVIGGVALAFVHPPWDTGQVTLSSTALLYLGFVIVFGTMIAFWFYIESLNTLTPKETSLLGSLEPLSAVLTTVFWLHQPFGAFQWLGTACIVGMVVVLAMTGEKNPQKR
ncbi:MAG: EamA family transporter [Solibacillus sp.]